MDKLKRSSQDFDAKEVIKLCKGCFEDLPNLNFDNQAEFIQQLYRPVYDCIDLMLMVNHPAKMKAITEEVITDLWDHRNKFLEKNTANFAYCAVVNKTLPLLNANVKTFYLIADYASKILDLCKTF